MKNDIGNRTIAINQRLSALILLVLFFVLAIPVHAEGNPAMGKIKAIACQVCHGKDGHSTNPIYPILASQHSKYIVKQMLDFKSGKRHDPVMNEMAQTLSEEDIHDIAAFFENVK